MGTNETPGERRANDQQLLHAIHVLQKSIDVRHTENTDHLESVEEKVDRILRGFPDGDPDGHRRFHEAIIRRAEASEKFWTDMRAKLIERGVWATLVFLAGAALYSMREVLHK